MEELGKTPSVCGLQQTVLNAMGADHGERETGTSGIAPEADLTGRRGLFSD
jgi:hypothetical protein